MGSRHRCLLVPFLVLSAGLGCGPTGGSEPPAEIEVAAPLPYVRIYADSEGGSHFAEQELAFTLVDFAPPAPPISVSEVMDAEGVAILSSPAGWHGDWHPSPRRQLMFMLAGELEVQVSDGEARRFGPGAVLLVEDTTGQGHISRALGEDRCFMATVPLTEPSASSGQ